MFPPDVPEDLRFGFNPWSEVNVPLYTITFVSKVIQIEHFLLLIIRER